MANRRKFLQHTSAFAVGSILLPRFAKASSLALSKPQPSLGIQLFTLSDMMAADPKGTLQKVAAIGYKELESAATGKGYYYGYSPKEFSAVAKDLGLHWRSHHVMGAAMSMERLEGMIRKMAAQDSVRAKQMTDRMKFLTTIPTLKSNHQQLADEAAAGGVDYLVCASIPVGTLDELKTAVEVFSKTGEACKKNGVQFAYHNHTTEFDQVEGHRPFDYILSNTDKELVKMELDLGWATKAGQDPVKLFSEHPGRFPLWHVKDMTADFKTITEIGGGTIDFKRIFDNAKDSGMKYFFLEQDGAPKPIENITNSYNYLSKLLGKKGA